MRDNAHHEILAAGAVAAFTVDMLVYPLDTIKTRYQSQGYLGLKSNLSSTRRAPYTAVRGLYQGIGSVVLATLPAAAVFFASYESTKPLLRHALPDIVPGPAIHAFASAGAEMASCLVLTPAEVIKQNAQVLQRSGSSSLGRSSSLQALRMLRRSGAGVTRTLWRGYTTLVARNLPYTAIQFPMFEYLRAQIWRQRQGHSSKIAPWATLEPTTGDETSVAAHASSRSLLVETGLVTGSAAAISGSLAATITTPADVVKTRVMLGNRNGPQGPGSVVEIVRTVLRENGIRGLFRGGSLRAAWAALGSGLYLGSYEATKVWLKHRSP
ncbi:mitochondrial carrier domain-containing protein [Chaetomium fimeti]|uniref:Mitochondrial carrier domain-containing protein n=1 Tax=Chaetomium fimeti TaxID=1854472 RepID=A0AAE0H8S4_9PEZI|nr:mitochondrial carrier domain-containing protein [Chaetomium fimeti]